MLSSLILLFHLLRQPGFVRAITSWRCFSATSFLMVSSLQRQGLRPRAIIDIGSNVGQFAYAAFAIWRPERLLSFEPTTKPFSLLQRTMANLPGVECHQIAVGDACGTLVMHLNTHSHSSSALAMADAHRIAFPQAQERGTVIVPVCTLDSVLEAQDLPDDVLLKIDVQGFERQVLAGARATLPRVRWVILEASLKPLYEGESVFLDLQEQMRLAGFTFRRPVGFLHDGRNEEILQMDCLFERN